MNTPVNQEQRQLWNGHAGSAWIEAQETLDLLFRPFEQRLVAAVTSAGARDVLDVGCGTGATTLAISRTLGPRGSSTGIDISQPMIDLARRRAANERLAAQFVVADAQTCHFTPDSYDMIVSRFGIMFFEDPVAAFANLRRSARAGATLLGLAFRDAAENPFMTAGERAAASVLPGIPARRPGGPGQFAFADPRRVRGILQGADWDAIRIEPIDVACVMPAVSLEQYLARLGPVGLMLRDADEATRERVLQAVRAAFRPYLHGGEVRFTAACWEIAARV